MPAAGRLGDKANIPADAHGCPGCPHPATGPAISGSPNVNVNSRPALRVNDMGIHAVCCGPNMWTATKGSATVFINGQPAHRMGDANRHCGGIGQLVEGSANVHIGDGGGAGGGGGGDSANGSGGSSDAAAASRSGGGSASGSGEAGGSGASSNESPSTNVSEQADETPPDQFVLSLEMKAIGGAPLANEDVVAIDPGTSEEVGRATADEHGRVSIPVPAEKPYHIRIVTEEIELPVEEQEHPDDHDYATHLYCQFFDHHEHPLAGEKVKIRGPGCEMDVETGPYGEIEPGCALGEYEVEVRGQRFHAHSMTVNNSRHPDANYYQFIVEDEEDEEFWRQMEAARRHRFSPVDEDGSP